MYCLLTRCSFKQFNFIVYIYELYRGRKSNSFNKRENKEARKELYQNKKTEIGGVNSEYQLKCVIENKRPLMKNVLRNIILILLILILNTYNFLCSWRGDPFRTIPILILAFSVKMPTYCISHWQFFNIIFLVFLQLDRGNNKFFDMFLF